MPKQKKNISKKKKILITGACGFLGINVSNIYFKKVILFMVLVIKIQIYKKI